MAEWYEQLLELQLTRNRDIWAGLREHGVGHDSALRLGFIYVAPGEAEAQALVDFLREETDYDIDVRTRRDDDAGPDEEDAWFVIGTTQPTPVTLELLDDWVEWMIAAGADVGPCAFDGWAAQLVSG
jgi:regulator of ribonuclease activity B